MEICLCILYEKHKCFIFLHTKQYKSLILLVHCDLAIHSYQSHGIFNVFNEIFFKHIIYISIELTTITD